MTKFIMFVLISILGLNLVACDTYYVQSPGEKGEKGGKGDPGEDAKPCTIVYNGDGTADMVCPDGTTWSMNDDEDDDVCPDGGYAATEPWGQLYHTDSLPEFQRQGNELSYGEYHGGFYLGNLDGCGRGFVLNGIVLFLRGVSITTDMTADLLIGGTSYGGVQCMPLNGVGIDVGDGVKCGWDLNVLFESADPEDVEVWVHGVPFPRTSFNVEIDFGWTDVSTTSSHFTMLPLFEQF